MDSCHSKVLWGQAGANNFIVIFRITMLENFNRKYYIDLHCSKKFVCILWNFANPFCECSFYLKNDSYRDFFFIIMKDIDLKMLACINESTAIMVIASLKLSDFRFRTYDVKSKFELKINS